MDGHLVIGVMAAGAAACCFDGAVVLQAQDARTVGRAHALRVSLLRRLVVRRRWVAGTALAVLGVPLQLAAFALAPVTAVQSVLALGLVLLLVAGHRVLGEPVGRRELLAVASVIAGVVLVTAFGPDRSSASPSSFTVIGAVAALVAVTGVPFALGARRATFWWLVLGAGAAFALSAVLGRLLVGGIEDGRVLVAVLCAAGALAASATGLLVDMTGLQRFQATRLAPPIFATETIVPVALAPWLFGESWPGGGRAGGLAAGLVLVLAGGAVLGASRAVARVSQDEVGGGGTGAVGEVGPTG